MTDLKVFVIGSNPNLIYRWQLPASTSFIDGTVHDLVATLTQATTVTVLLGSEHVALRAVSLKAKNRHLWLSALPYALEEHLASDIEQLHIAVGQQAADGTTPVAVIDKALIEAIIKDLEEVGIALNDVIPYVLAIPFVPSHWSIFDNDLCVVVRTGPYSGFTTTRDSLPGLLQRLRSEPTEQPPLLVWTCAKPSTCVLHDIDDVQRIDPEQLDAWLGDAILLGPTISLTPRTITSTQWPIRKLAVVTMLLCAALIVHTSWIYGKTQSAQEHLLQLRAATVSRFKSDFPEVTRIVNPRVQSDQALKALSKQQPDGIAFFDGLHALGKLIDARNGDTRITLLRYQQGHFSVALNAPDIGVLENLHSALNADSIENEIISLENLEGRVAGQLQLGATRR